MKNRVEIREVKTKKDALIDFEKANAEAEQDEILSKKEHQHGK